MIINFSISFNVSHIAVWETVHSSLKLGSLIDDLLIGKRI